MICLPSPAVRKHEGIGRRPLHPWQRHDGVPQLLGDVGHVRVKEPHACAKDADKHPPGGPGILAPATKALS